MRSQDTFILSCILTLSCGFQVMQPRYRTINPDNVTSISCEHTAPSGSVEDLRLNYISQKGLRSKLCSRTQNCSDVRVLTQSPWRDVFILTNIRPEATSFTYECEVTMLNKTTDAYQTKTGTPTKLVPGQQETEQRCDPAPPPAPPPPPPPPPPPAPPQSHHLKWILIGLLAVMSLYSCVITSLYIQVKFQSSNGDSESATYVEMRKAPLSRSASRH